MYYFYLQLNRSRGTISVFESNISKNKIDLKQAQYKDIDKRHFDQLIQLKVNIFKILFEVFKILFIVCLISICSCITNLYVLWQTTEMANKDLDRYYNALDKWAS